MSDTLLPREFLDRMRLGLSVSMSSDLARLGLFETHFRSVLGEIARVVLVAGGKLAYGGHLDPQGYTAFLMTELHRYGRRDRPMLVCLAWNEHRKLPLSELRQRSDLGLFGEVVCLDPEGQPMDPALDRDEEPVPETNPQVRRIALTNMRKFMDQKINGRVLMGGKRSDFSGELPGLMEEALLALKAGQPLYLAAGCGGVTVDIVRALGIDDCEWLPPRPTSEPDDPRLLEGYARLQRFAASADWIGLRNGLSVEENRALSASHRASDIATFVSLGLGRIARDEYPDN